MAEIGKPVELNRSGTFTIADLTAATTSAVFADASGNDRLERYSRFTMAITYAVAATPATAVVRILASQDGTNYGSASQSSTSSPSVTGGDITLPAEDITVFYSFEGIIESMKLQVVTYTSGTISATLRSMG